MNCASSIASRVSTQPDSRSSITCHCFSGLRKDTGIDDKFITEISQGIAPNSSMLFLMVQNADEKVLNYLKHFKARVLTTTLPPEEEARLQKILESEEY